MGKMSLRRESKLRRQGGESGWFHLFAGEVADAAQDPFGNKGPAYAVWVLGPSAFGPDAHSPVPDDPDVFSIREHTVDGPNGSRLGYLTSWTHEPTSAEIDMALPAEYRVNEGARHEQLGGGS
jgi:hypothetical protein